MDVQKIIDKFGSQTALATLLGIRQSAISYWLKKGYVPKKWHQSVLALASSKGIELSVEDFYSIENSVSSIRDIKDEMHEIKSGELIQHKEVLDAVNSHFMFYSSNEGTIKVQVILGDETVWASQKGMADIFNVTVPTINEHLKNIYESREIDPSTTIRKSRIVVDSGKEDLVMFYNLDAIISVGYRVNSYQATQFRRWATSVLKEYLIKGFALDDERLKQAGQLFGKDYFDDLLERIREIRASERRFYQKITDIYAQCSIDYDKDAPITHSFYAHVQDKLHFAIHGNTSAELIYKRADASKPHMGLLSYKNSKAGGKVTKSDAKTGKNYLDAQELDGLNRLVSMYLDFAENFARRNIPMRMQDWAEKLDDFLRFNAYEVLENFGRISREDAEAKAFAEYEKFRVIQDKEFKSDFDKVVDEIKMKKRLPKPNNTSGES